MVIEEERGERGPNRGRETEIEDIAAEVGRGGEEVEASECVCVCVCACVQER